MVKISSQIARPVTAVVVALVTSMVVVPTCQIASAADGYDSGGSSGTGAVLVIGGGLALAALFMHGASEAAASGGAGAAGAAEAGQQMAALSQQMTSLQAQLANTTDPAAKAAIQTQIDDVQAQMNALIKANPSFTTP